MIQTHIQYCEVSSESRAIGSVPQLSGRHDTQNDLCINEQKWATLLMTSVK